ncbi:MAG: hypothetical protein M0Q54_09780 [Pigmentiphaga sp.]|nr:hypothetical protein [Pigmentiphaga sp.]
MTRPFPRSATYADMANTAPQHTGPGQQTWITRGGRFVVAVTQAEAGATLHRDNEADEYIVLLPHSAARLDASGVQQDLTAESLTIVPPGSSTLTALAPGLIVRVFAPSAQDLLEQASNRESYQDDAPELAPNLPWPPPANGYRIRSYALKDYLRTDTNMRLFRTRRLMVNVLAKRTVPRDIRALSPHQHTDFEQGSLVIQGRYMHHLRYPWTKNMEQWVEDEHVEIGAPSLTVIPAQVIHTSRNLSEGDSWLIDIFGPPRLDFSRKPGLVCNADEYPMPEGTSPLPA